MFCNDYLDEWATAVTSQALTFSQSANVRIRPAAGPRFRPYVGSGSTCSRSLVRKQQESIADLDRALAAKLLRSGSRAGKRRTGETVGLWFQFRDTQTCHRGDACPFKHVLRAEAAADGGEARADDGSASSAPGKPSALVVRNAGAQGACGQGPSGSGQGHGLHRMMGPTLGEAEGVVRAADRGLRATAAADVLEHSVESATHAPFLHLGRVHSTQVRYDRVQ